MVDQVESPLTEGPVETTPAGVFFGRTSLIAYIWYRCNNASLLLAS